MWWGVYIRTVSIPEKFEETHVLQNVVAVTAARLNGFASLG